MKVLFCVIVTFLAGCLMVAVGTFLGNTALIANFIKKLGDFTGSFTGRDNEPDPQIEVETIHDDLATYVLFDNPVEVKVTGRESKQTLTKQFTNLAVARDWVFNQAKA